MGINNPGQWSGFSPMSGSSWTVVYSEYIWSRISRIIVWTSSRFSREAVIPYMAADLDAFLNESGGFHCFSGSFKITSYTQQMDKRPCCYNRSSVLRDIKSLSEQKNPQMIFVLNELNLFQMMQVPEVAAFKFFFWSKSNLSFSDYKDQLFTANRPNDKLRKLSMEILHYYVQIPTIELMAEEALSSMMKQICFYHEAGFFKGSHETNSLCDKLVDLMNHLRQQADLGFKFLYGIDPVGQEGNYMLYYNDLILADNTILIMSDETRMTYITSNAINLLLTDNPVFYERNYQWGKNLISKSTLISGSAEKERYKFYRGIEDQINKLRETVCT